MILNPNPSDWRELQESVSFILNSSGIKSEVGRKITTPRGELEVDVYGIDLQSVEKIKYIVECKNWSSPINQSVVHAFTTVMHETGGDIGFIISKSGSQSGAKSFVENTNIRLYTFGEFQNRYLREFSTRFDVYIWSHLDPLTQYTEPINSKRERERGALDAQSKKSLDALISTYKPFADKILFTDICDFGENSIFYRDQLNQTLPPDLQITSEHYAQIAEEIILIGKEVIKKFDAVFGKELFAIA
jgi:hypothetical protein